MPNKIRKFIAVGVFAVLTACATAVPETPRQVIAAANATYSTVAGTYNDLVNNEIITDRDLVIKYGEKLLESKEVIDDAKEYYDTYQALPQNRIERLEATQEILLQLQLNLQKEYGNE